MRILTEQVLVGKTEVDRVQEFLNLYNQLDEHMRRILGTDAQRSHACLLEQLAQRDPVFQEHHSLLQAYRALRNSIIHMPFSGGEPEPIAEPREDVLNNYRMLVRYLLHPPSALESIATREVYTASWETPIVEAISFIQKRGFDTVPVVERGMVVGMYTAQCLQRAMLDALRSGGPHHISPSATLAELRLQCAFSPTDPTNASDCPELIRFARTEEGVEAIEELFKVEARQMRFIMAVCVTPTGRAFEPLLGLITAHNLPSANGYSDYLTAVRRRFAKTS